MKKTMIAVAAFAAAYLLPAVSGAVDAYKVPDVSKAEVVLEEVQYIADSEPPTEVVIKTYKGADGIEFRAYSVGGNVFRYDVDSDGKPPYDYRLIDNDGDGVFETREELVGEEMVRQKGEKYFIDLGPEPGKEYHYSYEDVGPLGYQENREILRNYPIYIPQWVITRFR